MRNWSFFICGRQRPGDESRCTSPGCNSHATQPCCWLLSGKRAGETCGRRVCAQHGKGGHCPPHARLEARKAEAA